eukprot:CAMPEP_0119300142 /NCGR_PEP_ID=MMETSP1333-20130426/2136_1 /TAXON_ID=418940 /ORGANISM="Scyphosphaera apsteinii, Strain RCC1455" /LENGTH=173 /DNA_ID=CAMNT_0007301811 /DNA_START=40 /DNA_END=562 /DNA_ORIENTATION=+
MVISLAFNKALAQVAAALAVKVGALNLMTVRSRMLTGDFSTGKPHGKPLKEEAALERTPAWITMLFKVMLGAVGPTFDTERFVGLINNAKENEPFFIGVAAAVAIAGSPPAWGATALYTYCAARFAHAFVFLMDFPDFLLPYKIVFRATPYLVGVFSMFALAATPSPEHPASV